MTGTGNSRLHDILPLSPLQEGLLFQAQLDEDGPDVYSVQTVLTLEGPLDAAVLRASARVLLERHPNLRAGFRYGSSGRAVALIPRDVADVWRDVDVSELRPDERAGELSRLMEEESKRRFVLGRPPLLRFALVRVTENRHQLIVTNHHILLDGWSMPLLVRELFALYVRAADASSLPRVAPYRDYLAWLGAQNRSAAELAWGRALRGMEVPTRLAPQAEAYTGTPQRFTVELSDRLTSDLTALGRSRGITLNTVVAGIWGLLLARLLGRDDVVFGTTVSGRPPELPGVETMIGLFINTIPVRVRVRQEESFVDLLARLQHEQTDLMPHHHLGLGGIQRLAGIGDLFDTLAVFENYPFDPDGIMEPAPGLRLVEVGGTDATHYPLTLTVLPGPSLRLELGYRPDAFAAEEVARIMARLQRLLESLVTAPDQPVGRVGVLTIAERLTALVECNDTGRDVPQTLLPATFEARVALTPAATALVAGPTRLSFAAVEHRANRLARVLVERGIGPECIVALALPRTDVAVVAIVAVLKAGGAFLPIDADLPPDRIAFLLADARPALVLTTAATSGAVPPGPHPRLLLNGVGDAPEAACFSDGAITDADRLVPLRPANSAYLLYTSGSTGRPKGVVIEHGALKNLYANHSSALFLPEARRAGRRLRVALTAALSFDTSWEGLLAMAAGHELHVIDEDTRRDPEALVEYVVRERIDLLDLTPSFARPLFGVGLLTDPRHRPRVVMLGGEAAGETVWSELRSAPDTAGYNFYGPTECTVDTVSCTVAESERPIIGRPLINTSAYVLDGALQPVLPGVPGELYLAGRQLGRGYLRRPDLTAARFLADPYGVPGARMYRTGDIAWRRGDGTLEFVGRVDGQVKIRGFRIELGEIESVLNAHPAVAQAAVVAREGGSANALGEPTPARLVAYLVAAQDSAGAGLDTTALRAQLAETLPDYMVPAALVVLARLPLTHSGKLDHRALPAPEFSAGSADRDPRTPAEHVVAAAFAEVLGLPRVGVDANFFSLGGDSISSIQLVSRARAGGFRIRPRDVFRERTVEGLAAIAEDVSEHAQVPSTAEEPGERLGALPLTPIMRSLLDVGAPIDDVHQSMLLRAPADLSEQSLRGALSALLHRHDALRSRLCRGKVGEWQLDVPPPATVDAADLITRVDTSGSTRQEIRASLTTEGAAAVARLAPEDGVMVQVVWFDAGPRREGRLLLVAHHLVVDGVSWRILVSDLAAACAASVVGRPLPAPPPTTSFRRWALLLADRAGDPCVAAELPHWRSVLATPDPLLGSRPLDPSWDTLASAGLLSITVSAARTAPLLGPVPSLFRGSVNDVLLTALGLAVLLRRRRRYPAGPSGAAVLVDLEGHGREEGFVDSPVDLSRTVGWFTSRFPVRLDLSGVDVDEALDGGPAAGQALKRVKEDLRTVPRGGLGFGLLRHGPAQSGSALAVPFGPQIEFNYLGRFGSAERGAFSAAPEQEMLGGAGSGRDAPITHPLSVNVVARETDQGVVLTAHWSWASGVLSEAEVRELADDWCAALDALARHAAGPHAGGLTPSDLPLVSLTQPQIELLERAAPDVVDILPTTPLQAGLLYHALTSTDVDVYTVQDIIDLVGPLDTGLLRVAAHALLQRHPNLRSGFHHAGPVEPVQVVPADVTLPWREVDLSSAEPGAQRAEADRLAAAERDLPFDPGCPPLLRFLVLRLAPDAHRIVFTCHHLLLDGWATQLLARELFELYQAGGDSAGVAMGPPFRAYLAWLAAQDADVAKQAWAEALAGLEQSTLLAPRTPRSGSRERTEVVARLPEPLTEALSAGARATGVTVNTVIQAAWALLLAQLTGRDDVVFGQTVSGRTPEIAGVESMIGLLINTVPVRIRLRPEETLRQLLMRVQDEQARLIAHHHLALVDIQRAAGLGQLFDTLVVVESYPIDEAARAEPVPGLRVTGAESIDATHYPLTLAVQPGAALGLHLEYHPACFDIHATQGILDAFVRLLHMVVAEPARTVARVETLDAAARRHVLEGWNDNALPVPQATLPRLFAEQAARTPDATAVASEDEALTFAALDERANRFAHALIAEGVGPEGIVALLLPRSVDTVVALLGVLKAGAAYLPIDPSYPFERIAATLTDAAPQLVVTIAELTGRLPEPGTGVPPRLLLSAADYADLPATEPAVVAELSPLHPAYVIYTSGSTGTPKGVVVAHASVVNLFHSHRETLYRPTAAAAGARALRVGHTWSFAFDASWQPQLWMLDGHALHVVSEETLRDPDLLVALVRDRRLDFIEVSPSLGVALAAAGLIQDQESPLSALGVGGEAVPVAFWEELRKLRGTECYNLYGPTETTVDALAARVRDSEAPLVGRPTANTRAYLLDFRLQPVAPGVPGELYLGGAGLARGYLRRPGPTADRFVADPFGPPGARMYRTGDLMRWTSDGALDYLGRLDEQIKVRGFRVEPGEIATVLSAHEAIAQAVVGLWTADTGEQRLVAHVVPAPGTSLDPRTLRTYVSSRLPDHMVPAAFVQIPALPLTPHGKVDRAALPPPEGHAARGRPPEGASEAVICAAFADVLGLAEVGMDDDFFDLGGHSLSLVALRGRIEQATGRPVAVNVLFTARTPALVHDLVRGAPEDLPVQAEPPTYIGDGTP